MRYIEILNFYKELFEQKNKNEIDLLLNKADKKLQDIQAYIERRNNADRQREIQRQNFSRIQNKMNI